MPTLIFLVTVLLLLVLFAGMAVKLIRRKPIARNLGIMAVIVLAYGLVWLVFALSQKKVCVPMGTQVCFDDWCATVVKAERKAAPSHTVILLHIRMVNAARGIAQTPSGPSVHIFDANGNVWPYWVQGQYDYEKRNGTQPGIGHRLALHQTMETVIVFKVPPGAPALKAIIQEGPPWVNALLFWQDEQVFCL